MATTLEFHGLDDDGNPISTTFTVADDCTLFINSMGGRNITIADIEPETEWELKTINTNNESETIDFVGERSTRDEDRD